jgi:hypothetical protein
MTSISQFVVPSLDKEGWREAPGWFDAMAYHHPAGCAGTLPQVKRGKKSYREQRCNN